MQKILVTGAEGFTGSWMVKLLQERGIDVVGGVWNRARKLTVERAGGKALVCDVTDAINVARVVASVQPQAIIHLAGLVGGQLAYEEPLLAYQTTVTAWANILDAARRTAPRTRILLVSAADVYGSAHATGHAIPETTPVTPDSTFGSLKLAAESIAATFHRDYHLDVLIARPFNFVGAGQPDDQFWGSVALAAKRSGQGLIPAGLPGADARFDLLHVADVVSAYQAILQNGKPNTIYNVCSGGLTSFGAVWSQLTGATAPPGATQTPREFVGPIPNLCGDHSRLLGCGWKPAHSIESAVQSLATPVAPAPGARGAAARA